MYNPFSLEDRRIMVTGASSGLGRACAKMISQLGGQLVLVARDGKRLQETYDQLEGSGHIISAFDLSNVEAISAWMKDEVAPGGQLAGLVHCAGIAITLPIKTMKLDVYDRLMRINVTAGFALAKGFRQRGVCSNASSVVFIASVAANKVQPGMVAYSTSKAAIYGLTRSLAVELIRDGIRVNCITPGLVKTEMQDEMESNRTQDQVQTIIDDHLLGLGRPEDVAHSVVFLLAETGRWITGSNLVVDGGYSIN